MTDQRWAIQSRRAPPRLDVVKFPLSAWLHDLSIQRKRPTLPRTGGYDSPTFRRAAAGCHRGTLARAAEAGTPDPTLPRSACSTVAHHPSEDTCDPTLGCEEFLFFVKAARFAGGDAAAVGHAAWRPVPPAAARTLAFIGPSAAVTADPTEGIRRRSRRPTARALFEAGTSGRRE